jgi:hypothetical protein
VEPLPYLLDVLSLSIAAPKIDLADATDGGHQKICPRIQFEPFGPLPS